MTSAQPTFGDFLMAARAHLTEARAEVVGTEAPGRDVQELADAVAHVAAVLSRYTADLTRTTGTLRYDESNGPGPWDRAALQVHDALTSAVQLSNRPGLDPAVDHPATSAARCLHAAATSLTIGRDLLQGHFAANASGARLHRSTWALAITSRPAGRALLSEVASLAEQAAAGGPAPVRSARPGSRADEALSRLSTARYWLRQAGICVRAAERREPVPPAGREILGAVPTNALPPRHVFGDCEPTVAELREAVITTAERVRTAAWTAASLEPRSTSISVTSWHRIAAASTVTSHHCHLLCETLASRVAADRAGLSTDLKLAAVQAGQAREQWLDSARKFKEITTDVRGHASPAALEAADLALWTGKLAYADPAWDLASGTSQPVRPAVSLAARLDDVRDVVAAIHQSSEALSRLATANLEQTRQVIRSRRLLVAVRSLPDSYDIPHPFTVAPEPLATALIERCQKTAHASTRSAESVGKIAVQAGSPSRTLAIAMEAARDRPETAMSAAPTVGNRDGVACGLHQAGPVEARLRAVGITNARMLWRADAVDQAARQVIGDATAELAQRRQATSAAPRGREAEL